MKSFLLSHRLSLFLCLAFAIATAAAGCDDSSGSGDDQDGGGDPGDGGNGDGADDDAADDASDGPFVFADDAVEEACRELSECAGRENDDFDDLIRILDMTADCAGLEASDESAYASSKSYFAKLIASLDAGTAEVDEDELADCIANARECVGTIYDCTQLIHGTIEEGELCTGNQDCVSGACSQPANACGGVCNDQLPTTYVNEYVDAGDDCGHVYASGDDSNTATSYICPVGTACHVDPNSEAQTGTCETPAAKGDECDGSHCAAGLFCLQEMCRELVVVGDGDDCDAANSEEYGELETVRVCDVLHDFQCVEGQCEEFTDGSEESDCLDDYNCDDGFYCDVEDTYTCQPQVGNAEHCSRDTWCESGICAYDNNTCAQACPD